MQLSHTSALVLLLLGDDIYQTPTAKNYLKQLDLSAGQELHDKNMAFWPHYDALIKNRKFAVLHFCEILFSNNQLPSQIVIAGAGMDAMGLEIATRYSDVSVYELDAAFMEEKSALLPKETIHCITANLNDEQACYQALSERGWQATQPCLIIFEGISYYLSEDILANLIQKLAPTYAIADYLQPAEKLTKEAADSGQFVFDSILNTPDAPPPTRYTSDTLAKQLKLPIHTCLSLHMIEKERLGHNHHFMADNEGYAELALFGTRS